MVILCMIYSVEMCRPPFRFDEITLLDMITWLVYITLGDVNMPHAGLCDKLVENRNHVWSDLFRLVDVSAKNGLYFYSKHFSGWKSDSE